MWKHDMQWWTPFFFILLLSSTPLVGRASPAIMPPPVAIAQSQHWRDLLLKEGAAGLYQALDLAQLGSRAGLDAQDQTLLPRLSKLISTVAPVRVRVYWVATQQHWIARLDFPASRVNFLRLETKGTTLVDWQDYSLGLSLSQLLAGAAHIAPNRLRQALNDLSGKEPLQVISVVGVRDPLARLVLPACVVQDCYQDALKKLTIVPNEISLLALEKAVLMHEYTEANRQMQALNQQLGSDPAVTWLAATLAMTEGKYDVALHQAEPALTRWPGEARLYPLVSQSYMKQGKPSNALATLKAMEQHTHTSIDWKTLVQDPLYAPLKPQLQQQGLLP